MRRLTIILAALLVALTGPVVRAEDATNSLFLTDTQIALIRANCLDVQSTLQRIHANDALARFNLGQQYNIISAKLMAPMNSRVALNKLDGVAMTQTTVDFNAEVDRFGSTYQQYEETMQQTLKINCKDQPVSFLDAVTLARSNRASVRESVDKINTLLKRYRTQFDQLQSSAPSVTQGAQS